MGIGVVPVAAPKEYALDVLEMQADALQPGSNVFLFDDLIAIGGKLAIIEVIISLQFCGCFEGL